MSDPIVSISSNYDYIPGLSKIVHTIRKHFEYKIGTDVDSVEHYVIQLYNEKGKLEDHNVAHKIDKYT